MFTWYMLNKDMFLGADLDTASPLAVRICGATLWQLLLTENDTMYNFATVP